MGINKNLYFGTSNAFSFSDYGCYISGDSVYNAPIRVYDEYEIPGRNGNLLISQNRFSNIEVTYPAFIFAESQTDFATKMKNLRNKLYSYKGYQKITDDYHPDEFRMGVYYAGLEADPVQYNRAGQFEISFNCKPQRFLKAGDTYADMGSTYTNPTDFDAHPLIRIIGSGSGSSFHAPYGTFSVNGKEITISNGLPASIIIDCEIGEAYYTYGQTYTTNPNSLIIAEDGFPTLSPGENTIDLSSLQSYSKAEMKARTWRV